MEYKVVQLILSQRSGFHFISLLKLKMTVSCTSLVKAMVTLLMNRIITDRKEINNIIVIHGNYVRGEFEDEQRHI